MPEQKKVDVLAYLMHITHYDPSWYKRKKEEIPFDIKSGCDIIDTMAEQGFNTLILDCEDGVEYRTHPELKRHYTIPMAEFMKLTERARSRGLEVIPKLNFSKAPTDEYDHNFWFNPYNRLMDNREYFTRAFQIIDELIEACRPKRFFFIGMDEDYLRDETEFTAVIKTLHTGLGKRKLRPVLWNDTCENWREGFGSIRKHLAAEKKIPADCVWTLWNYNKVDGRNVERIRKRGFEVWIAPGSRTKNIYGWRHYALSHGVGGLVLTTWSHIDAGSRDRTIELIRRTGPVITGREKGTIPRAKPPVITVKVHPGTITVRENEVMAPNHLGKPFVSDEPLITPEPFVKNWMALGPFALDPGKYGNTVRDAINDESFIGKGEGMLAPRPQNTCDHGVSWRKYQCGDRLHGGMASLRYFYPEINNGIAYLVADISIDRAVDRYRIYFGSDNCLKAWLNGVLVYTYDGQHRGVRIDQEKTCPIQLNKGWNRLVLKSLTQGGDWSFFVRFANGKDIPLYTA